MCNLYGNYFFIEISKSVVSVPKIQTLMFRSRQLSNDRDNWCSLQIFDYPVLHSKNLSVLYEYMLLDIAIGG